MVASLLPHSRVKPVLFWQVMKYIHYISINILHVAITQCTLMIFFSVLAAELQCWLQPCKQKFFIRAGITQYTYSDTELWDTVTTQNDSHLYDSSINLQYFNLSSVKRPSSVSFSLTDRVRRRLWSSFCWSLGQFPMPHVQGCVWCDNLCCVSSKKKKDLRLFKNFYFLFRPFLKFSLIDLV